MVGLRAAGTWDPVLAGLQLYFDKYLLKQQDIKKQLGTENNYAQVQGGQIMNNQIQNATNQLSFLMR